MGCNSAPRIVHRIACGKRDKGTPLTTTMEKTNGKFDPKQREVLAEMLRDARGEERRRLENAGDASAHSILRDLAEEAGALNLVDEVKELESKVDKAKEHLSKLGFEVDSGALTLSWEAPGQLRQNHKKRMAEAKPSIEKSLKKYDLAVLGVWTAETAAEAKKIVEGLI